MAQEVALRRDGAATSERDRHRKRKRIGGKRSSGTFLSLGPSVVEIFFTADTGAM